MNHLYTDIDSTLNNHWERIKRWAIGAKPPRQIDPRAFSETEVLKDLVAFKSNYWLNQFKKAGWLIHYLTARPAHLESATLAWLEKNQFPVDSLHLVESAHDKPQFLSQTSVDLFVDDLTRNHENDQPIIYQEIVTELKYLRIPFVIFTGDWSAIYAKYGRSLAS